MTLDEAIEHCEEKANCGDSCGMEHKQLAEWLKELKNLREKYEIQNKILDKIPSVLINEIEEELCLNEE